MVPLIEACNNNFGVFIIGTLFAIVVVTTSIKAFVTVWMTTSRERTRREIAAYVAEGSITPDQGERLMKAQINGREVSA